MRILLGILLLLFVVSSCITKLDHETKLNSWIGAKESVLIDQWGTPTNHYKTDDGKKYLTWKNSSQSMIGGISGYTTYDYYGNAYTSPGMPPMLVTSNCDITMILEDGLVTSWKYKGNSCYDY